jgi:methylated-DNA-protein-cysteine methyltransferase-like protein
MEHTREIYAKIYLVVQQIPSGQVASYGDIAEIVGGGVDARTIGYALGELGAEPETVPWQRVVNREGAISTRGLAQRTLLESEGITFDAHDRVMMGRHRWAGPDAQWAAGNGCNVLPPRPAEPEQLHLF